MSSIITHVILPGLGPVCPECFSRGHVGALPVAPGEAYSYGITEPQAQLDWDVDAARALIANRPRTAQRLETNWLESWLTERTSITLQHLDHIPAGKLQEPGILIEIMAGPPGGEPQPFRILIDGTHRAARKLRDHQDYWAFLLTEAEQYSICTYRFEGRERPRAFLYGVPAQRRLACLVRESGLVSSEAAAASEEVAAHAVDYELLLA